MTTSPKIGNFVKPDGWKTGENLIESDGYKDSSFPGCEFRLPSTGGNLAVNIKITGRKRFFSHFFSKTSVYRRRVKIEFVGDGEPSTFSGGWWYHEIDNNLESTNDHNGEGDI